MKESAFLRISIQETSYRNVLKNRIHINELMNLQYAISLFDPTIFCYGTIRNNFFNKNPLKRNRINRINIHSTAIQILI